VKKAELFKLAQDAYSAVCYLQLEIGGLKFDIDKLTRIIKNYKKQKMCALCDTMIIKEHCIIVEGGKLKITHSTEEEINERLKLFNQYYKFHIKLTVLRICEECAKKDIAILAVEYYEKMGKTK